MEKTVLELINVAVKFDDDFIFQNVDLSIKDQEVFFIIGPSGAGKSVLIKTMAGILRPTCGEAQIYGKSYDHFDQDGLRELYERVGVLFQKNALFDSLTALENVEFSMQEHGNIEASEMRERATDLLDRVGLGDALEKYPHELSGGMQRRLGIARALALNPRILFYDDPTAGQDPITGDKIADLIMELKQKFNSTLIVVSNELWLAYKIANRIAVIAQGEIIACGSVDEIRNSSDPRVQQFLQGKLQGPLTTRK